MIPHKTDIVIESSTCPDSSQDAKCNRIIRDDVYSFIQVYCDFGYFMGFIPFRIKQNFTKDTFILSKSRIQQTFCILTHSMLLFRFVSRLRKLKLAGIGQKSIVYFDIFGTIATLTYQITFILTLWTKSQQILDVVNYVGTETHLPTTPANMVMAKRKVKEAYICLYAVL